MIRRCDGRDENLVMYVKPDATRPDKSTIGDVAKPCTCGLVFDDVRREVIYPHQLV